jgi:hypothetical protein
MSATATIDGLDALVERLTTLQTALADPTLVFSVGSDVEYAGFVEGGTTRMAARPYLAPAADQEMPAVLTAVAEGAVEVLETGDAGALKRRFGAAVGLVGTAAQGIVRVRSGNLRTSIHESEGE